MAKITVEPVLFFYMLCLIMSLPLVQQLAFKKICNNKYDVETCKNLTKSQEDSVHKKTSKWILYQSIAQTLPSIAASLILGSWSDKVGRKTVLILPSVGSVLLYINYILNVAYFSLDVNYILIGVCISSFFGGFTTALLGCFSYMSDITDKSQRTVRVAILESMIFLGGTGGNLIGGELLQYDGYLAAFGLCLGLNVLVIMYISIILPESYFPEVDHERNWALVAVHNHVKASFQVLTKRRPQHQRLNLLLLLFGIFFFVPIVFGGFNDITVLYSKHSPLNFSPLLIGYFLAEFLFLKGIGVVLGIPLMAKIFKWSDFTIAIVGFTFSIICYLFFGLASTKLMMFLVALIGIVAIPAPCLRSIISKQVESHEQGTTFALLASLEVLETLIASIIFNNLYSATVEWFPGFCYFLMSGVNVIPIILLLLLYMLDRHSNPYTAMDKDDVQSPDLKGSVNNNEHLTKPSTASQYGSVDSKA